MAGAPSGVYTRAHLAENGESICIVFPGSSSNYFYDTTSGLAVIADADFTANEPVLSVTSIDGYFVFTREDSNEFFISSLVSINKGQDFDALDVGSAEVSTDFVQTPFVLNGELGIAGTETIEFFRNIGGSGFPFQRIEGSFINKGIPINSALASDGTNYFFIGGGAGGGLAVWKGSSGGVVKISTPAIDNALLDKIGSAVVRDDTFVLVYTYKGIRYVQVNINDEVTYIYDDTTSDKLGRNIWHQRKGGSGGTWGVEYAFATAGIYRLAVGLGVDGDDAGFIHEIKDSLYDDDGTERERTFTTRYVNTLGEKLLNTRLELHVESGVGDSSTDDPQVTLSISDDGGRTFTSLGSRGLGTQNDYTKRLVWQRLGVIEDSRCYRFSITDGVKVVFTGVSIDIEKA